MFLIVVIFGLIIPEYQGTQKNLTTQNLNSRFSAYIKDQDNLKKDEIAQFKSKLDKCKITLSVKDAKISVDLEFPNEFSEADKKQMESVLRDKVLKDILGQYDGGLVEQQDLENVTRAMSITLRQKAGDMPKDEKITFDLGKFKVRFAEFIADPEKKEIVDSIQGSSGTLVPEASELDQAGRLVLKMRISQEPPKAERDRIIDLLKNRVVNEVLGNYKNPPLAIQDDFQKILGSMRLDFLTNPTKPPVVVGPNPTKPPVVVGPNPTKPPVVTDPQTQPSFSTPENVSELMGKAIRALKVYESAFALRLLNYVLSVDPENPVAWKLRAIALYDLGRDMEAASSTRWADKLAREIPGALEEISRAMEPIQGKRRDFLEMVRLMDIGRSLPTP